MRSSVGADGADASRTRRAAAGRTVRTVLLSLAGLLAPLPALTAQEGVVAGTVVAERTGAPIPDVQVLAEGTQRGAASDAAGRFRIAGLSGDSVRLVVRRIGYRPLTVGARVGDLNVRIALVERAVELNTVVVTGTAGATTRREIGNAVSQIKASEVVATAPVSNVQELLNARAPGVNIIQSSGQAGAGSRIRIRGASSLSLSNEPLIYVDGVRVDNTQASGPTSQSFGSRPISRWNDFNPEDIESIEVIKGPAAATLYGTEASNGVIQIITKKGTAGAARFDLTVREGAQWFQNPEGRIAPNYGVVDNGSGGLDTVSLDIVDLENQRGHPIFRTGQTQEYNLSVSGGSPLFRYYIGGAMNRDEGVETSNLLNRYNGRVNLSLTPSPKWDIGANAGYTTGKTDIGFESGGGGVTWTTYFATPENLNTPKRGFYSGPPEAYTQGFDIFQDINRFTGSITFNHRPLSWFSHRLIGGLDQLNEDNQEIGQRNDALAVFFEELGGGPDGTNGYMDVSTRDVRNYTLDYVANAKFDLTQGLVSTTSFGSQYYTKETRRRAISGSGFPAPGFKSLSALALISEDDDDIIPNKTLGYFGQEMLGWQDRLFLTGALRADRNSAFGKNFGSAYYPKFSASWIASEEPFFHVPAVSTLKLRAAYGQSGQQPVAFAAVPTYLAGGNGTITPGALGNPDLGPERSYETELGFDAGFLNDRAGVELTYFTGVTKDAILSRGVAPSTGSGGIPDPNTGVGIQYFNAGRVSRHGLEVLLRGQPVHSKNVDLDLTFNMGTNSNKIDDLGRNPDGTPVSVIAIDAYNENVVGYPVGAWFRKRLVSANADPVTGKTVFMCDDGKGGSVGCGSAPRVYLGNGTPKSEGAFTGALTFFQNFRLATLVDFKSGYKKMDGLHRVRCHLFGECRVNFYPQEFDPLYVAKVQSGGTYIDDLIRDASFTRLREVSLTYTLPPRVAQRVGGSRASVTVAGRNLHTWTKWPGIDPEASFNGGSRGNFAEWEQNVIPPLASFVTTFNIGF